MFANVSRSVFKHRMQFKMTANKTRTIIRTTFYLLTALLWHLRQKYIPPETVPETLDLAVILCADFRPHSCDQSFLPHNAQLYSSKRVSITKRTRKVV